MYHETRVIRTLLKRGWKYDIKWSNAWQGISNPNTKRIRLNVMKMVASVIIHENAHAQGMFSKESPDVEEEMVLAYERGRRLKMSDKEARAIVKLAYPKLYQVVISLEGI